MAGKRAALARAKKGSDTPQDPGALALRHLEGAGFVRRPDTDRYKMRFEIHSETSDSIYLVSFDAAPGARWWTCSCRGNIATGNCKHLKAMRLLGRAIARTLPKDDPRRMLPY